MTMSMISNKYEQSYAEFEPRYPISAPWHYGVIATLFAATITHPLEVIRINVQANAIEFASVQQTLNKMLKYRGLKGFFFAYPSAILKSLVQSTLWFTIYRTFKNYKEPKERLQMILTTGVAYGLVTPLVKIGVVMQADLTRRHSRNYKNTLYGLYSMYKNGKFKFLYQGYGLQGLFGIIVIYGQLPVYEKTVEVLKSSFGEIPKWKRKYIASILSYTLVSAIFTPFSVVRNVIMNACFGEYVSTLHALCHILQVHGARGLLLGFRTTVLRAIPLTVGFTIVYEFLTASL